MPTAEQVALALHRVKVAQEQAAAKKGPKRPRSQYGSGVIRGKLGWTPKEEPLPIRADLEAMGITAKNARGYGYFAVREVLDSVNHLNDAEVLHPGDRDYGVIKAKNGRTGPLPTKPAPVKHKDSCDGEHEGVCTSRLPQPEGMIRYR